MTEDDRTIEKHEFDWQGVRIEVSFERIWLGMTDSKFPTAHLEIRAVSPERAKLPMTETGFRSHFLPVEHVDEEGGPVAYVLAWLAEAAQSKEWKAQTQAARQLSFF